MSSFLAYLWSHKLILPHVLHSLKPKTVIRPHVLHSFRAKTVILPPVFHSLEIKPMMFLHLVRSFGSKTVKLPHVFAFFWRADLCAACSLRTGLQKNALQKNARSASGAKEGPRDENNVCCQMGRRPGSLQPSQAEACRKEIWNSDALYVRSFYKNKLLVAQSQQKKPVSAINLRFSTCLWQTYRAIIQTIYTGMVTLRLMCKQCWTGKNQSRPVAVPWLAVRPGSKSSKIDWTHYGKVPVAETGLEVQMKRLWWDGVWAKRCWIITAPVWNVLPWWCWSGTKGMARCWSGSGPLWRTWRLCVGCLVWSSLDKGLQLKTLWTQPKKLSTYLPLQDMRLLEISVAAPGN